MKENERNESEGFLFPALFSSQEKENKERERTTTTTTTRVPAHTRERVDAKAFAAYWNRVMREAGAAIPAIRQMTEERCRALQARCDEYSKADLLTVVHNTAQSRFLNGGGNKGWVANIDWVLTPKHFTKILEGQYTDHLNRHQRNRELYEAICREQRQARERMSQGAVTYEEYQRLKAQGLVPGVTPDA